MGLGEGEKEGGVLGTGGHGEVQGDLGSGETEQWSSTVGGRVRARSPLWNWLGQGVSPFRLFSSWIGGCLILIVMTVAGR